MNLDPGCKVPSHVFLAFRTPLAPFVVSTDWQTLCSVRQTGRGGVTIRLFAKQSVNRAHSDQVLTNVIVATQFTCENTTAVRTCSILGRSAKALGINRRIYFVVLPSFALCINSHGIGRSLRSTHKVIFQGKI